MKMHWCTCLIDLSGQGYHKYQFNQFDPVSWPEVQVLIALHGDENVMDIKACGIADVNPTQEKNRLLGKYGLIVERVFPGRSFRMELTMPAEGRDQVIYDAMGAIDPEANKHAAGIVDSATKVSAPRKPEPEQPQPKPQPEQPDDDGGETEDDPAIRAEREQAMREHLGMAGLEPPTGPATFKPGKHPRPQQTR